MQDLDTLESVSARLETVLNRLAARFRSMPESKLLGRLPDGRSRAAAGHELASLIAFAAQGIEFRSRPNPPAWRLLPFDGAFVVGDQIGVTGNDLYAACAELLADEHANGASTPVWAPPEERFDRTGAGTILARVLTAADELSALL